MRFFLDSQRRTAADASSGAVRPSPKYFKVPCRRGVFGTLFGMSGFCQTAVVAKKTFDSFFRIQESSFLIVKNKSRWTYRQTTRFVGHVTGALSDIDFHPHSGTYPYRSQTSTIICPTEPMRVVQSEKARCSPAVFNSRYRLRRLNSLR